MFEEPEKKVGAHFTMLQTHSLFLSESYKGEIIQDC